MPLIWTCRNWNFVWGERTLLMGIVNVTPDSFSDGGRYLDPNSAVRQAYRQFDEGADLVDIGGESSRPGSQPVPVEQELQRVIPVIEELAGRGKRPISIDTTKYEVAIRAVEAGAAVINDISGLQADLRIAQLAGESGAGLIIMHMRGNPKIMQSLIQYENLLTDIQRFFENQVERATRFGVQTSQIALDPGIGFSKTAEQNLILLKHLEEIRVPGYPLLIGVSRKSFIGQITGANVNDRLLGTAGAVAAGIVYGANIIRVHDVREIREVASVVDAVRAEAVPVNM